MPRVFQDHHIICATQELLLRLQQETSMLQTTPSSSKHCPYLQITLWGSLARACANLLAMSSDRYFTPAPKETRTKPFWWAPFTHAWRSCRKQGSHWTLHRQSTATASKHGLERAVVGALVASEAKFYKSQTFWTSLGTMAGNSESRAEATNSKTLFRVCFSFSINHRGLKQLVPP